MENPEKELFDRITDTNLNRLPIFIREISTMNHIMRVTTIESAKYNGLQAVPQVYYKPVSQIINYKLQEENGGQ